MSQSKEDAETGETITKKAQLLDGDVDALVSHAKMLEEKQISLRSNLQDVVLALGKAQDAMAAADEAKEKTESKKRRDLASKVGVVIERAKFVDNFGGMPNFG